jgi:hypothetical protein
LPPVTRERRAWRSRTRREGCIDGHRIPLSVPPLPHTHMSYYLSIRSLDFLPSCSILHSSASSIISLRYSIALLIIIVVNTRPLSPLPALSEVLLHLCCLCPLPSSLYSRPQWALGSSAASGTFKILASSLSRAAWFALLFRRSRRKGRPSLVREGAFELSFTRYCTSRMLLLTLQQMLIARASLVYFWSSIFRPRDFLHTAKRKIPLVRRATSPVRVQLAPLFLPTSTPFKITWHGHAAL